AHNYLQAREDYSTILGKVRGAVGVYQDRAVLNWLYLKDFDAALADCAEVSRLQPKNPLPYRIAGAIQMGRRQYDDALQSFRKALEVKADYTEVIWAQAEVSLWQGNPGRALEVIDPVAANLPPDQPEALNVRGDIYRALGRLDDAVRDYRRMTQLRPKEPDAYVSLALVYDRQGKADEARAVYDEDRKSVV